MLGFIAVLKPAFIEFIRANLQARLIGTDMRIDASDQECPICFMHYEQVNITKCCKAFLCTECYLQVKPMTESPCPFCNHPKLAVKVAGIMTNEEIIARNVDEQTTIEYQIRSKFNLNSTPKKSDTSNMTLPKTISDNESLEGSAFGSSLEREIRSRSRSLSSHQSENILVTSIEHRREMEDMVKRQCPSAIPTPSPDLELSVLEELHRHQRTCDDDLYLETVLALSLEECAPPRDNALIADRNSRLDCLSAQVISNYHSACGEEDDLATAIRLSLLDYEVQNNFHDVTERESGEEELNNNNNISEESEQIVSEGEVVVDERRIEIEMQRADDSVHLLAGTAEELDFRHFGDHQSI